MIKKWYVVYNIGISIIQMLSGMGCPDRSGQGVTAIPPWRKSAKGGGTPYGKLQRNCIFYVLLFIILNVCDSFADKVNGWAVGLNFPGLGLKYSFNNKAIELRVQSVPEKTDLKDENTSLIGIRFYKYCPFRVEKLFYYFGTEFSYFKYEEKKDKFIADGFVGGGYIGMEKFLSNKFSINLDLGPYYSQVSSEGSSTGLFDFVLNLSINYYFGGLQK